MAPRPQAFEVPSAADQRRHGRLRALAWIVGLTICAGVFALYLRPSVVVDLANRLWSCF